MPDIHNELNSSYSCSPNNLNGPQMIRLAGKATKNYSYYNVSRKLSSESGDSGALTEGGFLAPPSQGGVSNHSSDSGLGTPNSDDTNLSSSKWIHSVSGQSLKVAFVNMFKICT